MRIDSHEERCPSQRKIFSKDDRVEQCQSDVNVQQNKKYDTYSSTKEGDFSSSGGNNISGEYKNSNGKKNGWLPVGSDMVPEAKFCPDAIIKYLQRGNKHGISAIDVRKHLLHLNWKIEYSKQRFSYTSPDGKMYYSLRLVCLILSEHMEKNSSITQDENGCPLSSPDNSPSPLSEEPSENQVPVVSSSSDILLVEPKYCPEAAVYWYTYKKTQSSSKKRGDFQKTTLRARKHLSALGWQFKWVTLRSGKRELRYISPEGKAYGSLRLACRDSSGSSASACRHLEGKAASKVQQDAACQKIPSSTLKFRKPFALQKSKLGGIKKMHWKRKKRLLHSSSLHKQKDISDAQHSLAKLSKKRTTRTGTRKGSVLRTSKRVKQVAVPNPWHHKPLTVLSWLIDNNIVLPRAKVHFYSRSETHSTARGRITREGIKCNCCCKVYTLSDFKFHVSGKYHRPAASICLEDGSSLLDCQEKIVNKEMGKFVEEPLGNLKGSVQQDENDDICSVCSVSHDDRELLLCDQCPSSFHIHCLGLVDVPEGDWFCPSCCCKICGHNKLKSETVFSIEDKAVLNCTQCERKYHIWCIRNKGFSLKTIPRGNWFCTERCKEIFLGLNELLGKPIPVGSSNLTWTLLKPDHSDSHKLDTVSDEAWIENCSKLNIAVGMMHECFEPVHDPHTKRDLLKDVVFNKRSKLNRLNFGGFYTIILQKADEFISVATVRVYGGKVAELPLVGTRYQYRRLGMCRILMNVLEKKLLEFGVERLVLPVVPSMLSTWIGSFGFSKLMESERLQLVDYTFLDFQDTVTCHKQLMKIPSAESCPARGILPSLDNHGDAIYDNIDLEGSIAVSKVFQADQIQAGTLKQGQADMTTLCELHLHYGGKWEFVPRRDYVGGKVKIDKGIDIDSLSLKDIRDNFLLELGYKDVQMLMYLERGQSLDVGLIPLESDKGICLLMSKIMKARGGEVHIYALDEDDLSLYFSRNDVQHVGKEVLMDLEETFVATEVSRAVDSEVASNLEEVIRSTQVSQVRERFNQPIQEDEETSKKDGPYCSTHTRQEEDSDNEDQSESEDASEDEDYEAIEEECSEADEVGEEDQLLNSIDENVKEFRREGEKRHRPTVDFYVGQSFANAYEFRMAVSYYAVKEGVPLKVLQSEPKRVRYRCKATCNFSIYAAKDGASGGLSIRTLRPNHTCDRQSVNPMASAAFLANYFKETIRGSPEYTISEMVDHAKQYLSLDVRTSLCKNAKRLIIKEINEGYKDEYSCLEAYVNELRISNPGSFFDLQLQPEGLRQGKRIFWRLFICFHACKTGWLEGCRPIIGLDGCFLKDTVKGQMLVAIGHDAMDNFFPIAWAVIDKETKNNWEWFIGHLKQQLNLGDGSKLTIMSDMQKDLLPAISEQLPMSEHRWCARHVLANWSLKFRGEELQNNFWSCAWSKFEEEFKENLKKMGSVNEKATEFLLKYYPPQHWCRAFFSTRCKDQMVDSNMIESFNSWILEQRSRPILRMLEELRLKVMERLMDHEKMLDSWTTEYSPTSLDVYRANDEISRFCRIGFNRDKGYEVTEGVDKHCVVLSERKCTCREWQLSGIPCPHAICALNHVEIDPLTIIDKFYHKSMYQNTYKHKLQPVRDRRFWRCDDFEPIEPPRIQPMPGRPKKKRTRESNTESCGIGPSRKGQIQRCTICRRRGHKKSKCQSKPIPEQSNEIFAANSGGVANQSADKGKSVASGSSGIKTRQRGRPVRYGYETDGGPGNVDETIIYPDDNTTLPEEILDNPDAVITFPIPSESKLRQNRMKPFSESACGTRHIQFSQNEHEVHVPTDLSFEAPNLQRKGKNAMRTRQLEAERNGQIRKRMKLS
ncbi:uncharacterized protein [Euphorbia lathyris]|uniref:uncharacterized protein n=1 Tax=Euphorbia lathyris TaxID=212925 RepID=UPI003313BBA2